MLKISTKLTSQGQVSVPAAVRHFLNLSPGSSLVWQEENGRISVERAVRFSTAEVHQALFDGGMADTSAPVKTLEELKLGVRQSMIKRHARG